jgi:hypothetical protein
VQLWLYAAGVFYLVLSVAVLAEGGFSSTVPLYAIGDYVDSNFSTTGIVFSVLFLYLVRRDGWRGVFETILAGLSLDMYWSLNNVTLRAFYWWSWPVWIAGIATSLWFGRPWRFRPLNYPMLAFLVAVYLSVSFPLGAPFSEVPTEAIWTVAFTQSVGRPEARTGPPAALFPR